MKPAGLIILSLLIVSCSRETISEDLKTYSTKIPANWYINADLFHYEKIEKKISDALKNRRYKEIIDTALDYFDVYNQDDERGSIIYALSEAVPRSMTNKLFLNRLRKMPKEKRFFLNIVYTKKGWVYQSNHLNMILKNRSGYELEKKAVIKQHLKQIQPAANRKTFKKNLKAFFFIAKRFPDLPGIYEKASNETYFPKKYFSHKEKQQFENYFKIIKACRLPKKTAGFFFTTHPLAVIKNRPSFLRSRLLYKPALWETIKVHEKCSLTESTNTWYKVTFADSRQGFMLSNYIDFSSSFHPSDYKEYLDALNAFYHNKYIESAQTLTRLFLETDDKEIKPFITAFLYRTHHEIAKRATSLNNPYFRYARSYHFYFQYDPVTISLIPSRALFKLLCFLSPESKLTSSFLIEP